MKLNLGCGNEILDGYINFDLYPQNKNVIKIDLEKPLPFPSDYAHEIRIHGTLEHLKNWIRLMEEMYRVLKHDGILDISVPNFASITMFNDPTHRNFFTYATWDYFNKDLWKWRKDIPSVKCNFKVIEQHMTSKKYNLLVSLGVPKDLIQFMAGNIEVKLRADKNEKIS